MFILIRLIQHVSGIIVPIIRRTDYVNNCMWSMPGCVGCSGAEYETRAVCTLSYANFHTVHTARVPTLHDCSQHNQAYSTCSCLHSLFSWWWA